MCCFKLIALNNIKLFLKIFLKDNTLCSLTNLADFWQKQLDIHSFIQTRCIFGLLKKRKIYIHTYTHTHIQITSNKDRYIYGTISLVRICWSFVYCCQYCWVVFFSHLYIYAMDKKLSSTKVQRAQIVTLHGGYTERDIALNYTTVRHQFTMLSSTSVLI